jgi:hypothetical protein
MPTSVEVTGAYEIARALDALGKLDLQEADDEAAALILSQPGTPGNYPRQTSKFYQRTGYLGQSTMKSYAQSSVMDSFQNTEMHITVNADYGPYVVGKPNTKQAARMGWQPLEDVVDNLTTRITELYDNLVQSAIELLFG